MVTIEIFKIFGSVFLQDTEAQKSLDNLDKKGSSVSGKLGEMASMAGKAALGLAAIGGAAVAGLVVKGVSAADDLQKSLNGLQAATGTADNLMGNMKQSMLDIYSNNFGADFADIGKSMATIGQQTGISGDKLTSMTKNALALRDTFEFEVNESTRSAKMLMDQFGLSGEAAYNLVAQGAQAGLDKNGDLLDTINEYSVHFKQIGFDSTDMFNMLVNGAESGTFSVDKLGDAVKEFGIRSKDGSKTSSEAFAVLGLDATNMTNSFAVGGEKGQAAFEMVTQKLIAMEDPVAQNKAGVALFGTQWEDLGVKGVAALTNTTGKINESIDALGKINEVKYNTFGEAISGIGRQFETGVIIPVGEKVLPILNQFASWLIANMPAIKEIVNNAMKTAFDAFDKVYNVISTNLRPVLEQLWAWIQPNIPNIQKTVQSAFGTLTEKVIPALAGVFQGIVKNVMPTVIDVFNYIVKNVMPPLIAIFTFITTEVVPLLAKKFQEWIPKIMDVWNTLWSELKPIIDDILQAFNTAFPMIKEVVMKVINIIGGIISGLLVTLKGVIQFVSGVFSGDWGKAWEGIKTAFSGIWDMITALLGDVFKDFIREVVTFGTNIVKGLWDGINGSVEWLKSKVKGFSDGVSDTIKKAFGIASPSKLMMEYGKYIVQGLGVGINDNAQKVIEVAKSMAQKIIGEYDKLGDAIITGLKNRYAEEERLEIERLDKKNAALLRDFDAETMAQVQSVQDKINTLNNQTKLEERAIKEQELAAKVSAFEKQLLEAKTAEEKEQTQKDLNILLADNEREHELEQRAAQIESLRSSIDQIRINAEEKRKEKTNEFDKEMESTKAHYENLLTEENLQAKARSLILRESNDELIGLLATYNPKWQDAGQTFGQKLLEGINSQKESIRSAINDMVALDINKPGTKAYNEFIGPRLTTSFPDNFIGPRLPGLALGGNVLDDGAVMVGEHRPEILSNIKGARVTPLDKVGGITINITGNTLMNDRDADKLGDLLVRRLKVLGVT